MLILQKMKGGPIIIILPFPIPLISSQQEDLKEKLVYLMIFIFFAYAFKYAVWRCL